MFNCVFLIIDRCNFLCLSVCVVQDKIPGKKLKDFKAALQDPSFVQGEAKLQALKQEVTAFAETFPTIGY